MGNTNVIFLIISDLTVIGFFYLPDIENTDINYTEMFEDTKEVIRNRKAKKERQCNGQMKKDKNTIIYKHISQLGQEG